LIAQATFDPQGPLAYGMEGDGRVNKFMNTVAQAQATETGGGQE